MLGHMDPSSAMFCTATHLEAEAEKRVREGGRKEGRKRGREGGRD